MANNPLLTSPGDNEMVPSNTTCEAPHVIAPHEAILSRYLVQSSSFTSGFIQSATEIQ